jgi:hypothetical protein
MGFLDWFRPKPSPPQDSLQSRSDCSAVANRNALDRFFAANASEDRSAELTGRWEGSYIQCGADHAIAADLIVAGGRLTGTMTDGETESERSVFEMALEAGLPPGADELIIAQLRQLVPDAPGAPVRSVTQLPSASVLEGSVRGRFVSFRKIYRGEHFSGYRVGDRYVGVVLEHHVVHYQGELNDSGTEIQGNWWIEPARGAGGRRAEGSFWLRRLAAQSDCLSADPDSA